MIVSEFSSFFWPSKPFAPVGGPVEIIKTTDVVRGKEAPTPSPAGTPTSYSLPPAPAIPQTPAPAGAMTPAPAGIMTPAPAGVMTPAPAGIMTPAPAGMMTPAPAGVMTPAPAGSTPAELPTPAPTPPPATTPAPAPTVPPEPALKGAPRADNLKGVTFDIFEPGMQTLINVPRDVHASHAMTTISGLVARSEPKWCAPTFMEVVMVNGTVFGKDDHALFTAGKLKKPDVFSVWIAGTKYTHHELSKLDKPKEMGDEVDTGNGPQKVVTIRATNELRQGFELNVMDGVIIKVELVHHKHFHYLDLEITGMKNFFHEIGGLLGLDSHRRVSKTLPTCPREDEENQGFKVHRGPLGVNSRLSATLEASPSPPGSTRPDPALWKNYSMKPITPRDSSTLGWHAPSPPPRSSAQLIPTYLHLVMLWLVA